MDGKVSQIYVEFPDRLTRFGYPFLKTLFDIYHVPIIHTENPPQTSIEQQLLEDMMTLMACFSGKLYQNRSHQQLHPDYENEKIQKFMNEFIENEEAKIERMIIRHCLQHNRPNLTIPTLI
jgi:predicted site-specific integrase-resolvase